MIALLALAGLCDRIRGGFPEGKRPKWVKYLAMALIGPIMAAQLSTQIGVIAALVVAGHSTMWRQDNGYKGQFIQGNYFEGSWKAARWGLVASIPFLVAGHFDQSLLIYGLAFPLGNVIAHFVALPLPKTEFLQLRNAWPWSELISLPIIGLTA